MDTILDYFKEKYPQIFVLIVFAILLWFVYRWIYRVNSHIKTSKEDYGKLDATVETKVLPKLDKIVDSVHSLVARLSANDPTMNPEFFQVKSPVELSKIGMKLLTESGGMDYVNKYLERLISKMETRQFQSALDVQTGAVLIISEENNLPEFKGIKDYIYQNPKFREKDFEGDVNILTINNIMGIFLRNRYFDKHPELKEIEPSRP